MAAKVSVELELATQQFTKRLADATGKSEKEFRKVGRSIVRELKRAEDKAIAADRKLVASLRNRLKTREQLIEETAQKELKQIIRLRNEEQISAQESIALIRRVSEERARALDAPAVAQRAEAEQAAAARSAQFQQRLGAAIAATGAAFLAASQRVADYRNDVVDMSARTGLATETLSGLRIAAEQSGRRFSDLNEILNPFVLRLGQVRAGSESAEKVFTNLGISLRNGEGQLVSNDEVFRRLAERISSTTDESERLAIASGALGEGGGKLVQVLGNGATSLEEFTAIAERLGVKVTPEAARQAQIWQESVTVLRTAFDGTLAKIVDFVTGGGDRIRAFTIGFLQARASIEGAAAAVGVTFEILDEQVTASIDAIALSLARVRRGDFSGAAEAIAGGIVEVAELEASRVQRQTEAFAKKIKEGQQTIRDVLRNAARNQQAPTGGDGGGGIGGGAAPDTSDADRLADQVAAEIDAINEIGISEEEAIQRAFDKRIELIGKAEEAGLISAQRSSELTFKLFDEQDRKISELQGKRSAKEEADAKKRVDELNKRVAAFQQFADQVDSRGDNEIEAIERIRQRDLARLEELANLGVSTEEEIAALRVQINEDADDKIKQSRLARIAEVTQAIGQQFQAAAQFAADLNAFRQEQTAEALENERQAALRTAEERIRGLDEEHRRRVGNLSEGEKIARFASQKEKDSIRELAEARRKQFFVGQAAAVSEAVIAQALAVAQAFAQLGPVGGAIAAPLVAANLALQIAKIKNQQPPGVPSFHRGRGQQGRTAPDEVQATILRNEIVATPEQLANMTRQEVTVIQAYNHRTFDSAVRDATARGTIRQRENSTVRAGRARR